MMYRVVSYHVIHMHASRCSSLSFNLLQVISQPNLEALEIGWNPLSVAAFEDSGECNTWTVPGAMGCNTMRGNVMQCDVI